MVILYLIISSCFGDLIAFNRGLNTIQQNNFQVLAHKNLKSKVNSPNSLRVLAELLKNDRLRTRLVSNKMKVFFQSQKEPHKKKIIADSIEITAQVPGKEPGNRWRNGFRRKRNLFRKSFIRKWLVTMKFNGTPGNRRVTWNCFWINCNNIVINRWLYSTLVVKHT